MVGSKRTKAGLLLLDSLSKLRRCCYMSDGGLEENRGNHAVVCCLWIHRLRCMALRGGRRGVPSHLIASVSSLAENGGCSDTAR